MFCNIQMAIHYLCIVFFQRIHVTIISLETQKIRISISKLITSKHLVLNMEHSEKFGRRPSQIQV
jgi:hypothetical protein